MILKEQERLDKLLPGLRKAKDFLSRLADFLSQLTKRTRYMSIQVVRDYLQFQENETFEELVRRRVPLADDDIQREITGLIVSLIQSAQLLRIARDEQTHSLQDVLAINEYAEPSRQGVQDRAEMLAAVLKTSDSNMAKEIETLIRASESLATRLGEAESRRRSISDELGG